MKKGFLALTSLLGLLSIPAFADSSSAFYLNGALGYGGYADSGNAATSSMVGFLGAGYQFNPYVALEAGYSWMPTAQYELPNTNSTTAVTTGMPFGLIKGIYPVSELFDVFAKAGIGCLMVSGSQPSINVVSNGNYAVFLYGIGSSTNLGKHVVFTIELLSTLQSAGNVPTSYSGLGELAYKF